MKEAESERQQAFRAWAVRLLATTPMEEITKPVAEDPPRKIREIARDIRKDWKPVSPEALPYLEAMSVMVAVDTDKFGPDSARSVLAHFLSCANDWQTKAAKRLKVEILSHIKRG